MPKKSPDSDVNTDRKSLVVRHNKLIESKHSLSLTERRFLLWIISRIKKDDEEFKTYSMSVKDWEKFVGLKPTDNTYNEVFAMANSLTKRNVGIKSEDDGGFVFYPWFASVEYKRKKGRVEACLNEKIMPHLLQLKEQYTVITLEYALLLKSSYAHRIYDLLKQYEGIGSRVISLSKMREILDIDEKYQKYKDFRVRVLDAAQKEINQKTDIAFEFEPIKEGRKVAAILFTIHAKEPVVTLDNREETDPKAQAIFQKLKKHDVSEKTARELVSDYENDRLEWHITEYEKRLKAGRAGGTGWLIEGIKQNYRPQQSIFEQQEEEKRKKSKRERERRDALNAQIERIKAECDEHNRNVRMGIIRELSNSERAEIDQEFKERNKSFKNITEKLDTEGLEHPAVRGLYLDLIRQKYPDSGMSYRDYAKERGAGEEILKTLS